MAIDRTGPPPIVPTKLAAPLFCLEISINNTNNYD